jgi:hypothetical protein
MDLHHHPRADPYPDELDQLYCDECETLCIPPDEDGYDWRPCACCYVASVEDAG